MAPDNKLTDDEMEALVDKVGPLVMDVLNKEIQRDGIDLGDATFVAVAVLSNALATVACSNLPASANAHKVVEEINSIVTTLSKAVLSDRGLDFDKMDGVQNAPSSPTSGASAWDTDDEEALP